MPSEEKPGTKMTFDPSQIARIGLNLFTRPMENIKEENLVEYKKKDSKSKSKSKEKEKESDSPNERLDAGGSSKSFAENCILGTVDLNGGSWRILGIRHRREDKGNNATEYDVMRLPNETADHREVINSGRMEHVLRLCRVEDTNSQKKFQEEYELIEKVRKSVRHNRRFLDCFPKVFGYDRLSDLHLLRSDLKEFTYSLDSLKPFYVMEKIEPNLETVMKAPSKAGLGQYSAVFLTIGCLNALRHLHRLGYVHRNVQPSMFAVRLGFTGKLHRKEVELAHKVAIIGFSFCRNYRKNAPRKNVPHVGVAKYSSPAAMRREEQTPVDDCICCIYFLYEMLAGTLPWMNTKADFSFKAILGEKEKLETVQNVLDHEKKLVFENFKAIFTEIRKANGYDKMVDYEAVTECLKRGLERKIDTSRDQVVFGFQHPTMISYRHGVLLKDGKLACDQGLERVENVPKGDFLFPASRKALDAK